MPVGQRFHGDDPDVAFDKDRQDVLLKALEMRIEHVHGHLDRIPVEPLREHVEMNLWVFMARKPNEPHFPRFLGLVGRLDPAILGKNEVRIVLVDDLVELPKVDKVGFEPP